jgi:hypothetical protein
VRRKFRGWSSNFEPSEEGASDFCRNRHSVRSVLYRHLQRRGKGKVEPKQSQPFVSASMVEAQGP